MHLIMSGITILLDFIGAILTNVWVFFTFFTLVGIVTIKTSEAKGAGVFCLIIALYVLVKAIF